MQLASFACLFLIREDLESPQAKQSKINDPLIIAKIPYTVAIHTPKLLGPVTRRLYPTCHLP